MYPAKDYVMREKALRLRQSKLESAIEVTTNIFSGFIVSFLVWLYIVPVFWPEHASSYSTAFGIVVLFTVSSVIRSYLWRRFFESELHKLIHAFVRGLI